MKITPRHQRAIAALLRGKNLVGAAAAAGVSTMTLHRWRHDPDFQAAYQDAVQRVFGEGLDRLRAIARKAVRTLEKGLRAHRVADQIKAADRILAHGMRAVELIEMVETIRAQEERIRILENRASARAGVNGRVLA